MSIRLPSDPGLFLLLQSNPMTMQLIDGNKTAAEIRAEIKEATAALQAAGKRVPHLVAILVGNDGASETYVSHKVKDCEQVGFRSTLIRYPETVSEAELLARLQEINADDGIDGVIVQMPLPKHISEEKVIESIHPSKDVDGFHPVNIGRMVKHLPSLLPATPAGVIELLNRYHIDTHGKHVVMIGRSHTVGSPLCILLWRGGEPGNSTVTVCHRYTENLADHARRADILVVAVGKKWMVTEDMVKPGAVVIDIGITREEAPGTKTGYKLYGDVDFERVARKCSFITPVPGGVGPMTRAMLLKNTLQAYEMRNS